MFRLYKPTFGRPFFLSLFLIFGLFFEWGPSLTAQVPEWQRLYGGIDSESEAERILPTDDGGAVVFCNSSSSDQDVQAPQGGKDGWLLKLSANGEIEWQQNFGGPANDEIEELAPTQDGGYILAGWTESATFLGHTLDTSRNAFVVKLDNWGELEWSKVFGGPLEDQANSIIQTAQGDYLVTLASTSQDGGNLPVYCAQQTSDGVSILKLNSEGTPLWQRCLGGSGWDYHPQVATTTNGDIVFVMNTNSSDGDITGPHGGDDIWVAKLDSSGTLLWERALGGSGIEYLGNMLVLDNGRIYVAGYSNSNDGDLADNANNGGNNGWLACLDSIGNLLWSQAYGGDGGVGFFNDVNRFGDHLIAVGYSTSDSGEFGFQHGIVDGWITVIDTTGTLLFSQLYGGSRQDIIQGVSAINDGYAYFCGTSLSNDFNVHSNHGWYDLWVGRLSTGGFNTICGSVHFDFDGDGIIDPDDRPVPDLLITSQNGDQSFATISQPDGQFSLLVGDDSVSTTFFNPFPLFTIVPDTAQVSYFPDYYEKDTLTFFLTVEEPVPDLAVDVSPGTVPRPGFPVSYFLKVRNQGNVALNNETIYFEFPSEQLNYLSDDAGGQLAEPGLLAFDAGNLLPFAYTSIQVDFTVNPIPEVNLGDTLSVRCIADSAPGEWLLVNNGYDLQQVIVGSYDPNDKTVLNRDSLNTETLAADSVFLDYLIRFQNTGTDTAFNVVVRDTLDARLDGHTFQLLDASHPMEGTMRDGRYLRFDFRNILLPDSTTNEPESHGYILYRVRPKPGLVAGDRVENTAHIYFDFNPPIVTNTVATVVYDPIPNSLWPAIGDNPAEPLTLYPNPTAGQLFFQLPAKERGEFSYQILTMGGKVIANGRERISVAGRGELIVAGLPAGAYLLRVLQEEKTYAGIFIRD